MKIAFIAPYGLFVDSCRLSEDSRIDAFLKMRGPDAKAYSPCDSLLQLAALTPSEHEIFYMDDQYGNVDISADIDIAAISLVTSSADRGYEIADEFRSKGIHVVMGGIHTTLAPEDAKNHADTVITGDADHAWPQFLSDFMSGKSLPRYDGGCSDIKKLPPPKISLLTRDQYFRKSIQTEQYSIHCSSGCTRACKYCSNWMRPGCDKYQWKSLDQIEAELKQIVDYSDNFCLLISDDNLFLDVKYAKKVLELIRSYNISWFAPAEISIAKDDELLALIKDSGCLFLCIGFESLDERNLKWLAPWKAKQVKGYDSGIKRIREYGINVMGSFMIGMDYDTPSTFRNVFDFFMLNELSIATLAILTPFPGTLLRDKLIDENRLDLDAPWGDYTTYNLLFDHPNLSKEEIYDGVHWFMEKTSSPEVVEHIKRISLRLGGCFSEFNILSVQLIAFHTGCSSCDRRYTVPLHRRIAIRNSWVRHLRHHHGVLQWSRNDRMCFHQSR